MTFLTSCQMFWCKKPHLSDKRTTLLKERENQNAVLIFRNAVLIFRNAVSFCQNGVLSERNGVLEHHDNEIITVSCKNILSIGEIYTTFAG